jgi:hypothetical protein
MSLPAVVEEDAEVDTFAKTVYWLVVCWSRCIYVLRNPPSEISRLAVVTS